MKDLLRNCSKIWKTSLKFACLQRMIDQEKLKKSRFILFLMMSRCLARENAKWSRE
jgi:hypothetical protein